MRRMPQAGALLRMAFAAVCLAVAGCETATPSTQPPASDTTTLDLSGSAWEAVTVLEQEVAGENVPRLEFDHRGRPSGRGFSGCDEFGFEATFSPGSVIVGDLTLNPSGCQGPGAQLEEAFLTAFQAARAWSVEGDRLTLGGDRGRIVLARELPPMGDPGRQLADVLGEGEWRIVEAPGVVGLDRLPPVLFADRLFVAAGECGFSGEIRFGSGGSITIREVGWDTAGCGGANDGRPFLQRVLEAVTMGRPGPDGTIALSGPEGEVVLGR